MDMRLTIFSILFVIPLLSSCAANMESVYRKSDANAPVNEINGGVVSYLNQGANSVIARRRKNAYKKMHDRCQGDYKILQEGESVGEGIATTVGGSVLYGQQKDWKIKFECVH